MKTFKQLTTLSLALSCLLVAPACGDSDGDDGDTSMDTISTSDSTDGDTDSDSGDYDGKSRR